VEVNCETDFTGKSADFTEFVKNVAMHIAASNPIAVNRATGSLLKSLKRKRIST
jgi:translation elongation factor EF-Ts